MAFQTSFYDLVTPAESDFCRAIHVPPASSNDVRFGYLYWQ
jgi:hypothetical protein